MNGFSCLMFIFALAVFIAGVYIYTGHKSELLLWRVNNVKKMTKKELKEIGKWTIISSIIIFTIALIGLLIN